MITKREAKAFLKWVEKSGGVNVLSLHKVTGGEVFQIDLMLATNMTPVTKSAKETSAEAGKVFLALGRYMMGIRKWPKAVVK